MLLPNRIIRDGILTSDRVDMLDFPSEVFYRRLLSRVDDHGLFDARLSILLSSLYPLRIHKIKESDISSWLADCEKAGLLVRYTVLDGKSFLKVLDTRWPVRSSAKFPAPPSFPQPPGPEVVNHATKNQQPAPATDKTKDLLQRLIKFSGSSGSSAFYQKSIRVLGHGRVEEALGDVKMRYAGGSITNKSLYLTTVLKRWMDESATPPALPI